MVRYIPDFPEFGKIYPISSKREHPQVGSSSFCSDPPPPNSLCLPSSQASTADDYFVPQLEALSERLGLQERDKCFV